MSGFDIFLIIALLILIATPIAVNLLIKINDDNQLVNLYISARFEELLGNEMTDNLLNEFNENNPDIRVRLINVQEEKEPDIIIYDETDFLDKETALAVLNSFLDLEHEEDQHKEFSVNLVTFMDVLFYNINILQEAGFDRPPRTRGEYNTYSRTMQERGFYTDDLTEPENNKPAKQKQEDFANGKAAMIVASTRAISYFKDNLEENIFSLSPIPYATDGSVGRYDINFTGIYAGINANSVNMDAAWRFIAFLKEQSSLFCEYFKAIPGTVSDIIPGDYVYNDPLYSKAWDIFEYNKTEGLQ